MKRKGFTLIEILIVVAIIAILVTLVVPNFLGIRIRARDAKRKSDLSQIQKALELYKSDQSPPTYPPSGFNEASNCNQCWSQDGWGVCTGNIYFKKFPCDPKDYANSPYYYNLDADDNLTYTLTSCLENGQDADRDAVPFSDCDVGGWQSYTIT